MMLKTCPFDGAPAEHALENGIRFVRCSQEHKHRGADGCHVGSSPGRSAMQDNKCDYCFKHKAECMFAEKAWEHRA